MAGGTFPTSLPTYTATTGTEFLNTASSGLGVAGLFNAMETDITALATKMGSGSATPSSNTVLAGNGAGTSTWTATLTNFTLVTPTIASFTNAQHTHSNAAGGGSLGNGIVGPSVLATGAATATVATSESTAVQAYTDLTTTSDTVTVTIGANGLALVSLVSNMANNVTNSFSYVGFAVSGATTVAASDAFAIKFQVYANNAEGQIGGVFLVTGLTPGSNTFKMKYRTNANTSTFLNRRISVVPL